MKIKITLELDEDHADPQDSTGLSEQSYEALVDALNSFGEDIEITKVDNR